MPRVLIVDDEENQLRSLSIGLRLEGFEVVLAASSQDALQALHEGAASIDLALIDLMMPGINGLDLARQMRRLYPSVRVVLSSAYHLSARQVERADCGAIGFVPKPYRLTELCSFLRSKTTAPGQELAPKAMPEPPKAPPSPAGAAMRPKTPAAC